MIDRLHRRGFLQVAGAAAGSMCVNLRGASGPVEGDASAHPRFLTGCCAYSYGDYLKSGKMTMEDFIRKAVELEIDAVDITTYWLKSTEPDYLLSLRHLAFKLGVLFSGIAIRNSLCYADADKRTQQVEEIKKWVDATETLGTSQIRVFGGKIPNGATDAQGIDWVVETLKPACDYAAKKGVTLAIETHHEITEKAANVVEILRRVDSPYAAVTLDVSNWLEEPYGQIETLVPYATNTHIRDFYGPPPRPLDLDRVWQIFAKAGYKGFMTVEYENKEDQMTGVPKLVEQVKALCKKYSSV
ncbi:MAG: sugar phosphate isomerase/epimerase family protein [Terriglobia bacterium]|jgi:sugar phosphate isomerase/epimerase